MSWGVCTEIVVVVSIAIDIPDNTVLPIDVLPLLIERVVSSVIPYREIIPRQQAGLQRIGCRVKRERVGGRCSCAGGVAGHRANRQVIGKAVWCGALQHQSIGVENHPIRQWVAVIECHQNRERVACVNVKEVARQVMFEIQPCRRRARRKRRDQFRCVVDVVDPQADAM